jgi:AcrR family transcriptional regulator
MMARGRRKGQPDTRTTILAAARTAFAELGYDGASIRRIAAGAGVDPALVHHYFGSKERLFTAALELPFDPAELAPKIAAGGLDGFGERLIRAFVTLWDSPAGSAGAALLRSATQHAWAGRLLREFLLSRVAVPVLGSLGVTDPMTRGSLVASQILGLAVARYVMRVEPLASMPPDQVAALVGPTIQRYLTVELPVRAAR